MPGGVATQHKQQKPRRIGDQSALTQVFPAQQVGHVINDDLGHDPFTRQPTKKVGQARFADLGLVQFPQAHRDRLGPQFPHHRNLGRGLVDLGGFAGDLQHHGVAHGGFDGVQRIAVTLHVEAVAPLGVANVQVQHGRAGVQTELGHAGKSGRGEGHGRMVAGLLVGAIGGDRDDEGVLCHGMVLKSCGPGGGVRRPARPGLG